jgi:G3E family GTPase
MTLTTLVVGGRAAAREATITAALDTDARNAVILEGLPDGSDGLDTLTHLPHLQIARIAPGCMCCTGNLIMRVTLNRMLRHAPARLYIGVAASAHLAQIRRFLTQPPYDTLLTLTDDISCEDAA